MALESLASSKLDSETCHHLPPLVSGVSDPPFCFPGVTRIVGLHFNKQPFPLLRRLGVLRSRKVHITWRKQSPFTICPIGYQFEGGTCCVGGQRLLCPPTILILTGRRTPAKKQLASPLAFSAL
jgi:hypothetical protein